MARMLAVSGPTWAHRTLLVDRGDGQRDYGLIGSVRGRFNRRIGRAREKHALRREQTAAAVRDESV